MHCVCREDIKGVKSIYTHETLMFLSTFGNLLYGYILYTPIYGYVIGFHPLVIISILVGHILSLIRGVHVESLP